MKTTTKWVKNDIAHSKKFHEEHINNMEKCYKINDLFIWCIQKKYDDVYKEVFGEVTDEYGIQVWTEENRDIFKGAECLENKWFNNATEANESFKEMIKNLNR